MIGTLDNQKHDSLYTTEFVEAIVAEFWTFYTIVFDYVFIPFLIRTFSCLIYFSYYIQLPEGTEQSIVQWILKLLVYITTIYFAALESMQIWDKTMKDYFTDPYNWIDLSSAIMNLVLMVNHDFFATKQWITFRLQ